MGFISAGIIIHDECSVTEKSLCAEETCQIQEKRYHVEVIKTVTAAVGDLRAEESAGFRADNVYMIILHVMQPAATTQQLKQENGRLETKKFHQFAIFRRTFGPI